MKTAASPRRVALAIAILALPAAPIPALAQAQFITGPYVAGGAGVNLVPDTDLNIDRSLSAP